MRRLQALAERRVAGKELLVGNAVGGEEREELRRLEPEVLRILAASEAINLECFIGAALREQHLAEHARRPNVPRLRGDGAPEGALGRLEPQLPAEQSAVIEVRIGPVRPVREDDFQLCDCAGGFALRGEDVR